MKGNYHLKCNQTNVRKNTAQPKHPDSVSYYLIILECFYWLLNYFIKFKDIIDVFPFSIIIIIIIIIINFVLPILYSLSFTKTELTFHILIYEFWAHGFPNDMWLIHIINNWISKYLLFIPPFPSFINPFWFHNWST